MKKTILPFLVLLATSVQAQLYYKDILGTRETNQLLHTYTANRVNTVSLVAYDADGSRSADFSVSQRFLVQEHKLITTTSNGEGDPSVLVSWLDEKGRVKQTVDSSIAMVNKTEYLYDDQGRVQSIISLSTDSSQRLNEKEEHLWVYDGDGRPTGMTRRVNGREVAQVRFKLDDAGNVIEEQSFKNEVAGETVYYYYNSQRLLTDIVRYNMKARRLLPDYLFEYSNSGQLLQKITVPGNNSNYLIWRYQYDDKGLKVREAIFNKEKQLTGKIEYSYRFG